MRDRKLADFLLAALEEAELFVSVEEIAKKRFIPEKDVKLTMLEMIEFNKNWFMPAIKTGHSKFLGLRMDKESLDLPLFIDRGGFTGEYYKKLEREKLLKNPAVEKVRISEDSKFSKWASIIAIAFSIVALVLTLINK